MDKTAIDYWTEEIKEHDSRLSKLDDMFLSLVKFYFIVAFSLVTATVAIYDNKILDSLSIVIPWIFLLPLFVFGIAVLISLKKIISEYNFLEIDKNQIREMVIYGEIKNELRLFRTPLESFYTLISWMVVLSFLGFVYSASPFIRTFFSKTIIYVVISIFIASILASIVLVSLNEARKKARDANRKAKVASLKVFLEMYKSDNDKYPIASNINELLKVAEKYIKEPISDPVNDKDFYFEYMSEDGLTYNIRYKLEKDGERVTGPNDDIK